MNETSLSLLDRVCQSGDSESWNRLVWLYAPLLKRWLDEYEIQHSEVDDIVEEILVAAVKDLPELQHHQRTGAFRSRLRTILADRVREFWRSREYQPIAIGTSSLDERLTQLQDDTSEVSGNWNRDHDEHVINRLIEAARPHFERKTWLAFRRQVIDGEQADVVARELGMSVSSVHMARSRVLDTLRRESKGLVGDRQGPCHPLDPKPGSGDDGGTPDSGPQVSKPDTHSASPDSDCRLVETLADEFTEEYRRGANPSIKEYIERHPELADEIRELFPAWAATARSKARKERSPSEQAPLHGEQLERLGDFRIVREIARGGVGVVFEAEQESLGRRVAIKVLPKQALLDERHLRRFQREAQTAARLQHQNVVGVLNVGEENGMHFIVMQYVAGETLADRIERTGRLPVNEALDIMVQVCEGLEAVRRHEIVHRDVKPSNVMIDNDGIAKLMDLGMAKSAEHKTRLTTEDTMLGTPSFISPEQTKDAANVDHRSDLYSLGCTFFYALCGTLPYYGTSTLDVVMKHNTARVPDPRTANPNIPTRLALLIMKLMAKSPMERYQTAREVAEELKEIRRELAGPGQRAEEESS